MLEKIWSICKFLSIVLSVLLHIFFEVVLELLNLLSELKKVINRKKEFIHFAIDQEYVVC